MITPFFINCRKGYFMKRKISKQSGDSIKSDPNFDSYIQNSRALIAQADCMDDSDEARDHYKEAYLNCKAALSLKPDHPGIKAQIKYIKKELQRIEEAQDLDEAEKSQAIYVQEKSEHSNNIDNVQIKRKIPKKQTKPEQDKSVFSHEAGNVHVDHREGMISIKQYIEFVEGMAPGEYEGIHVIGSDGGTKFNLDLPTPMDME